MRVISRLNVGGPAIQAITLTARMTRLGYDTLLVHGQEGEREGSMGGLADQLGVRPRLVPSLRRAVGFRDLHALLGVLRVMYRFRPDLVHTHASKGGTIGRLAGLMLGSLGPRVMVHTFHGHVLEGYFTPRRAWLYMTVERTLAARTTRIVAVSDEVRDALVRLRIAPPSRISVVPLGFDLSRFQESPPVRRSIGNAWRAAHGLEADVPLVLLVARFVPIKRVDRFLRVANLIAKESAAVFAILGDGELRGEMLRCDQARALGRRLHWIGFEENVAPAMFASDVVMLTSDNEGTPVSLIEAHAAGVPAVATDVGGVRAVVRDGETGFVRRADDEVGLSSAVVQLLREPEVADRFGKEWLRPCGPNLSRSIGFLGIWTVSTGTCWQPRRERSAA